MPESRTSNHRQFDNALVGKLAGVAEQVEQALTQPCQIRVHGPEIVRRRDVQTVGVLGDERIDG
jgi:hypothetical protein